MIPLLHPRSPRRIAHSLCTLFLGISIQASVPLGSCHTGNSPHPLLIGCQDEVMRWMCGGAGAGAVEAMGDDGLVWMVLRNEIL